ncbi:MAG: hypothetical protein ACD_81C00051G0001 [uncultured bacterium]|uniref:Uncharacterized protein n=2 Tax=Candidatus Wolfeibacteriota TaxID=1752735 RepID=A0A0G1K6G6_9BACT|nr:MAG: hypothetical protein ACD_81C00051G0001 [uncultured bacterium]KKR12492.1 MAG: hypothetical protein UT41_C0001G0036 [Candidatus Wolfebacteria bacterium GW2011_GWC2_39_22]KKT43449.1 MAG: hypothetical protein UW32_C0001G0041 [Candidatus Wolfebacteria bacterium GW2011_GWE2_44_13]HBI25285.1 hypothetical protein [Candidatus Wolfebacteria bacterium]
MPYFYGDCRRKGIRVTLRSANLIHALLSTGIFTNKKFSVQEMEMLLHYLWEKSSQATSNSHNQEAWMRLQIILRNRGVSVEIFSADERLLSGAMVNAPAKNVYHLLWSAAVGQPRYIKREWQLLGRQLSLFGIFV